MKEGSWEFLLFDEEIPTAFGFTADMALFKCRQAVEKFRQPNEVIEETNTEN